MYKKDIFIGPSSDLDQPSPNRVPHLRPTQYLCPADETLRGKIPASGMPIGSFLAIDIAARIYMVKLSAIPLPPFFGESTYGDLQNP